MGGRYMRAGDDEVLGRREEHNLAGCPRRRLLFENDAAVDGLFQFSAHHCRRRHLVNGTARRGVIILL